MIEFDEMDERLQKLGKNRQWLADASGRAFDSIRTALAPGAPPAKRSSKLQRVLSDAIEREEAAEAQTSLPERIILEVSTRDYDNFSAAAKDAGLTLKEWIIAELARAARKNHFPLQSVAEDPAGYGEGNTGTDPK